MNTTTFGLGPSPSSTSFSLDQFPPSSTWSRTASQISSIAFATPEPHNSSSAEAVGITQHIYYVADPSVSGTITLFLVSAAVSILCIILHEVLRRRKVFFKLFYTRIEACRKEAPEYPESVFGWVVTAISTPETHIIEKVGLDSTMFLRFLKMSFIQFALLTCTVTPILTALNYFSTNPMIESGAVHLNQTEFSQIGLYKFSISNIPNGASILIVHTVFVALVTFGTWWNLLRGYRDFAVLSTTYLREDNSHGGGNGKRPAWRLNEALQLRTVLVQNIPGKLRSGAKLIEWFKGLGIGDVEIAIIDKSIAGIALDSGNSNTSSTAKTRSAQKVIGKLLAERNETLTRLEKAFCEWSQNIQVWKRGQALKARKLTSWEDFWVRCGMFLRNEYNVPDGAESTMGITAIYLDEEIVQKLRPKLSWLQRRRINAKRSQAPKGENKRASTEDDAIDFYTDKLNKLTAMVRLERVQALETNLVKENESMNNGSAFVTFKTQRTAQIAAQVLLFSSFNRYKMYIQLAPAPQDVLWNTISMYPIQRQILSYIVNAVCLAFTFFWVVPAGFFATLTNIEELAKLPSLSPIITQIAKNEQLYVFLKTIGPPLVVNSFNVVIPYIFEFIISLQGLECRSKIETRTLKHYFLFLLFNVLLVFALSTAVWNMIGNLVENPVTIFKIMAETLPNGATFFVNYITIDCIFFALELLRPVILIWNAFCRVSNLTPRQVHEMNLSTSYLNFGILYPIHILIFIIGIIYSVAAPLILIPTTIYFGFGYIVYRNQLLFVYVKEWEAFGRHWTMAFGRIILGLIIFQVTMAGIFLTKGATFCSIVPIALIPMSLIFHHHCQLTFEKRTRLIPLDQLPPEMESENDAKKDRKEYNLANLLPKSRKLSQKPDSTTPVLDSPKTPTKRDVEKEIAESNIEYSKIAIYETSNGDVVSGPISSEDEMLEPHVVLSPEESLIERYPVSYLNPVFSKPLPRPWLPLAVAGYWQLLPRYVSEPELEVPEIVLHSLKSAKVGEAAAGTEDDSIPVEEFPYCQNSNLPGINSASLEALPVDKIERLKRKAQRKGSMVKGMIVVGLKDEVANSQEKLVDLEISNGEAKKWKSKDSVNDDAASKAYTTSQFNSEQ